MIPKIPTTSLEEILHEAESKDFIKDIEVSQKIRKEIKEIKLLLSDNKLTSENIKTFWPPRLIKAMKLNRLIGFFGAGLSIPSGLPSWSEMLENYFDLDSKYLTDKELESDPLTLAELASNHLGADRVQELIRKSLNKVIYPASNHLLLACLRLPIYITTNYDCLFEKAWKFTNSDIDLKIIKNDADLLGLLDKDKEFQPLDNCSYLFKIHGCVQKTDEKMILTRSDYRTHYRVNNKFFSNIIDILSNYHTLFLGFSHRDPEVTRLVEEAIWNFESEKSSNMPHFYSLQFNMRSHTPEIFAARGIVAISPPIIVDSKDTRSASLARALIDIQVSREKDLDTQNYLDDKLEKFKTTIETDLGKTIDILKKYQGKAISSLLDHEYKWLKESYKELDVFASQGVYLLDEFGQILSFYVENVDNMEKRKKAISLNERPYFQQAKSFRIPFISNVIESIYNGFGTLFICYPLITEENKFKGLLFSAFQIGQWTKPIELSQENWNDGYSVIIVDSNGICLFPPNNEIPYQKSEVGNDGYKFHSLLKLSRKDRLISRIVENVIPIQQDDDVLSLGQDLKYYSVATKINNTNWKLAISKPIKLKE